MNLSRTTIIRVIASVLISTVFAINMQAGIDFFFYPEKFLSSFELSGMAGSTAVAGTGLLFLMWNIPYAFALWNPIKNRVSLIQAILMQLLGCVGESFIYSRIPQFQYPFLSSSIKRFIIFDSIGLILLLLALMLVWKEK